MTNKIMLGIAALIIIAAGLWYWLGSPSATTIGQTGAQVGQRCGGNMVNAPVCASGLHCAPEPGSHLPFGDVGGICVEN